MKKLNEKQQLYLKIAFALLVVVLLVWNLSDSKFEEIKTVVREAHPFYLSLACLLTLLFWMLRGVVLWLFLRIFVPIRFLEIFSIAMIGGLCDQIFPFRGGWLIRWLLISQRTSVPKLASMTALVSQYVLEGLCLFLFLSITFLIGFRYGALAVGPYIVFVAFCLCFGLFVFSDTLFDRLKKIFGLDQRKFFSALLILRAELKKPRLFFSLMSIISLGILSAGFPLMATSQAFSFPLSFAQMIWLLSGLTLSVLIPLTPGNLGTLQLALIIIMEQFGASKELSLAFALTYHLVAAVPVALVGLLFLGLYHLRLPQETEIKAASRELEDLKTCQPK